MGDASAMEKIERFGWHRMQWARGFTLLHWAAKHDRADLCEQFMAQGGDPYHRDDSGRNAFDYAKDRNALNALAQLERQPSKEISQLRRPVARQGDTSDLSIN